MHSRPAKPSLRRAQAIAQGPRTGRQGPFGTGPFAQGRGGFDQTRQPFAGGNQPELGEKRKRISGLRRGRSAALGRSRAFAGGRGCHLGFDDCGFGTGNGQTDGRSGGRARGIGVAAQNLTQTRCANLAQPGAAIGGDQALGAPDAQPLFAQHLTEASCKADIVGPVIASAIGALDRRKLAELRLPIAKDMRCDAYKA